MVTSRRRPPGPRWHLENGIALIVVPLLSLKATCFPRIRDSFLSQEMLNCAPRPEDPGGSGLGRLGSPPLGAANHIDTAGIQVQWSSNGLDAARIFLDFNLILFSLVYYFGKLFKWTNPDFPHTKERDVLSFLTWTCVYFCRSGRSGSSFLGGKMSHTTKRAGGGPRRVTGEGALACH